MDQAQASAPAPLQTITPELAAALVKAQAEVKSALKTSVNDFHKYKYASAEQVLLVGRDALNENGLAMIPEREDFEPRDLDDKHGGAVAVVRCSYIVVHITGACFRFSTDVPVCPERGRQSGWSRPADKATFGARTEALGYALRDLLLIPREDAPDVSGRQDGGARREAPKAQAAPTVSVTPDVAVAAVGGAQSLKDLQQALVMGRRGLGPEDVARVELAYAKALEAKLATMSPEQVELVASYVARANLKGTAATLATAALEAARQRAPVGAP